MKRSVRVAIISAITLLFLYMHVPTSVSAARGIRTVSEVRHALVIGNAAYQNSPLNNPVNDAIDMAMALEKLGFSVSVATNASQRTMEEAIQDFGDTLLKGGVGLFYFAGHGVQVDGRNYLIPIGARIRSESDVKYEAVDAGRVLGKMDDAQNDLNIVVLDACRNNPYTRRFRSAEQGLAQMDAPKGSLVAYSTAPGSVAADGDGRNSTYTKHLLKHIFTPNLPIEITLKEVREDVIRETGQKQVPWESSSLVGNFYFNHQEDIQEGISQNGPGVQSESISFENKQEVLFWESIKDSNNKQLYRAYLNKYPRGAFSEIAKIRLDSISNSQRDERLQNNKATIDAEVDSPTIKLAILPFWTKSFGKKVRNSFHRGLKTSLSSHPDFTLAYSYHDFNESYPTHEVLKKLTSESIWENRGFLSISVPKSERVFEIGREMKVDLFITYYLNIDSKSDILVAYLFDINNEQVYKSRGYTGCFTCGEGEKEIHKLTENVFYEFLKK